MTDRNNAPRTAMILAAGHGLRMRPVTSKLPKPMIPVHGRPLIDHAVDRLIEAGVERIVVNLHHLGETIRDHLAGRNDAAFEFSWEEDLLETGGGVLNALDLLGEDRFFVVNSDTLWLNGPFSALARLAGAWNDGAMDAVLLLHSTVEAYGYSGYGDFIVEPDGVVERRPESEVAPYLFTGVQILHRRAFNGAKPGKFSLNVIYDNAIAGQRLYGVIHDGEWFHVGTPEGLEEAEDFMAKRFPGTRRR
jgi:MurNAc alpha-1-phosphate uridylyltransferase